MNGTENRKRKETCALASNRYDWHTSYRKAKSRRALSSAPLTFSVLLLLLRESQHRLVERQRGLHEVAEHLRRQHSHRWGRHHRGGSGRGGIRAASKLLLRAVR